MKAWELLKEKGWCQGALAKTKAGAETDPDDEEAFYFCAVGALEYCYGDDGYSKAYSALMAYTGGEKMLSHWNDDPTRTKEQVIMAFKQADV